jgi:hypothetical protein
MATVITVIGVTALIYEVLERDYGVPKPTGGLGGGITTGGGSGGLTQAQVQTLINASIAAIPAGTTDQAAVEAIIEAKLTEFGPMIQQAVQSQFKAMPKSIRLNTDDGKVSIEGLDVSGPNKPVSLDMELPDGSLSVNGKRVLTVDDALDAAGGGIDQAAIEAAVQAATATLTAAISWEGQQREEADINLEAAYQYLRENKADKSAIEGLESAIIGQLSKIFDDIAAQQKISEDIVEWVIADYVKKAEFQSLLDAITGPDATVEDVAKAFKDLNAGIEDLVRQLVSEVLGVPLRQMVSEAIAEPMSVVQADIAALKADKSAPVLPEATAAEIKNVLTGGVEVPPNIPWTACTNVGGSGNVEARLINGVVQFRGDKKANITAGGSLTTVLRIPAGFPGPAVAQNIVVHATNTGVSFVTGLTRIDTSGAIGLAAPNGKFDTASYDGVQYLVF